MTTPGEPEGAAWPVEGTTLTLGSRRATAVLVVAVVLLAGLASSQAWYLWGQEEPTTSPQRPVVTGTVSQASAVEAAATSLVAIVSASYRTYDDQVELAASRMTGELASDLRDTRSEVRADFIAQKTEVSAEVAAQGVVRASPEEVVALVFLDQSTTKAGADLDVAEYTFLVTMVREDSGWLVSDVQTR